MPSSRQWEGSEGGSEGSDSHGYTLLLDIGHVVLSSSSHFQSPQEKVEAQKNQVSQ